MRLFEMDTGSNVHISLESVSHTLSKNMCFMLRFEFVMSVSLKQIAQPYLNGLLKLCITACAADPTAVHDGKWDKSTGQTEIQ